jgi:hypothetical protein
MGINRWKVVVDESVYGIDLASTVSTSEGESEQDNEIFKIRYEYSPNTTSSKSREFCIKWQQDYLIERGFNVLMQILVLVLVVHHLIISSYTRVVWIANTSFQERFI